MGKVRSLLLLILVAGCSSEASQPVSVSFEPLRQGGTGTLRTNTDFVVARTQVEWDAAWRLPVTDQHGARPENASSPPAVDFSKSMVVGIVFPAWHNGCTSVTITAVTRVDKHINVEYSGHRQRPDEVCTAAFRAPYVFVTVATDNGEVRFVEASKK